MTRSNERARARDQVAGLSSKEATEAESIDVGAPPPPLPRVARPAPPAAAPEGTSVPQTPPGGADAAPHLGREADSPSRPESQASVQVPGGEQGSGREVRAPHAATAHSFSLTAEAYKRFTQLRQSSESAGETLLRLVGTAVPELRERVAAAPGEIEPLYGLFPAVSQGARKRRGIERRDLRVWMYQAHRDVLSRLAEELTGGNASELVTECILVAGAHPEVRAGR